MNLVNNVNAEPSAHTDDPRCCPHLSAWLDHLLPLLSSSPLYSRAFPRIYQPSMDRFQDNDG